MISYFCILGRAYSPPLDHTQVEPEIQRRKAEGDPWAIAYCQHRDAVMKQLHDELMEMPLMRLMRSADTDGHS